MAKYKKKKTGRSPEEAKKTPLPRPAPAEDDRGAEKANRIDPLLRVPIVPVLLFVLLVLVFSTRYYRLDHHGFHHDESIHCLHSWNFVNKARGPATYKYNPVYHGPFLYHWGALFHYFGQEEKVKKEGEESPPFYHHLLADDDWTARAPYATVGVFLVLVFALWAKRFGWGTTLLLMGFLTLSPTLDYFSRFARNDVYQTAWMAGTIVGGVLYFSTKRVRYLTLCALFLVLSYATKENSYVNNFALCSFVVFWGAWRVIRGRVEALREILVDYLPAVRLLVLFGCFCAFAFSYVAIDTRIGPETGLVKGVARIVSHSASVKQKSDASAFKGESGFFTGREREGVRQNFFRFAFGITLFLLILVEAGSLWLEGGKRKEGGALRLAILAGVTVLFYALLGERLYSLAGWLTSTPQAQAAHNPFGIRFLADAVRGAPPEGLEVVKQLTPGAYLRMTWLVLILDVLFLWVASLAFLLPDLVSTRREPGEWKTVLSSWKARILGLWGIVFQIGLVAAVYVTLFSSLGTNTRSGGAGVVSGMYDYLAYWFKHQTGDYRIWGAWWYYLPRLFLYELLPILTILFVLGLMATGVFVRIGKRIQRRVRDASVNREGVTEVRLGRNEAMEATDDSPRGTSDYWKPVPTPLLFFAGYLTLFMVGIYAILNEKVPWLVTYQSFSLCLLASLLVGNWFAMRPNFPGPVVGRVMDLLDLPSGDRKTVARWGAVASLRLATCGAFLFLLWFTGRQHLLTVFLRPDYPTELLLYTGTTHEFADQVREIRKDIQRGEEQGKKTRVVIQGKSEWPSAWYFRNENVGWKTIDLARGDIQILDDIPENRRTMNVKRGKKWDLKPVNLRGWWIWHGTPDALPGKLRFRDNLVAFLKNERNDRRAYFSGAERPKADEYVTGFRDQVLNYAFRRETWYPIGGEKILVCRKTDEEVEVDEKLKFLAGAEMSPVPLVSNASFGSKGSEPGQFDQPRGLCLTPDGNIAVADSKNGRIQVLTPKGETVLEFGKGILSAEVSGVSDLVCDSSGTFFVADTWNASVRKFSATGELLTTRNRALSDKKLESLWGPRGIALNASEDRVFVTDTGNAKVRVYDRNLRPLLSWGDKGKAPGLFHEPVGIALDSEDRVYVADTGNGRVQRFSAGGEHQVSYATEDPPEGRTVAVEPHLEAVGEGKLALTLSTSKALWLIDTTTDRAQIRRLTRPEIHTPTGLAFEPSGKGLWVGDRVSGKIVRVPLP